MVEKVRMRDKLGLMKVEMRNREMGKDVKEKCLIETWILWEETEVVNWKYSEELEENEVTL